MKCLLLVSLLCLLSAKASPIDGPQTAIVHGNDVPALNYVNFHVHLLLDISGISQVGSGVYIGTTWVLTVAQNILPNVNGIRCGFGNRDRFQLTWVNSFNFTVHPEYNSTDLDNNIALLQLESNPTNFPNILRIPMSHPSTGQSAGVNGIIYGFGLNEDVQFPQILQEALITITSDDECVQTFAHLNGRLDRTFCGISGISPNTPNMCGGDQGGPFVVGGVLVGLSSSFSGFSCSSGLPSSYVRVSAYRPWILEVSGF